MPLFYPSFQSLNLANRIFESIADQVPGYVGRLGTAWYWRLPGGTLVTMRLDYTVTEERWDTIRAQAANPRAGMFNSADFPFVTYATSPTSPPYIHDLKGIAEWANRLYFNMGHLIADVVEWLEMLSAAILNPRVTSPATFPILDQLEQEMVVYALEQLDGHFTVARLYDAFNTRISRRRLSQIARQWEEMELLTAPPRRVTYAMRALVEADV
ncbi:MAG: hypothetical protein JXD18_00675 [Anaerolineae bacterium]|nr:hypothetical protein [Anaerolineae bacterium]